MDIKNLLTLTGEDSRPDHEFEPKELNDGIMVEMEHTNNTQVAKVIAKTHLLENPAYYQILKQVGL